MIKQSQKIRILIFGHKEFSQLVSSVLEEFEDHAECKVVDAIIGTIHEANTHIHIFKPDLVISAGSNSAYLKTTLDVPVMSIPVTESDIVSAILKASKVSQDIHLITYDDYSSLVKLLNQSSSVNITFHQYETAEDAKQMYQLAHLSSSNVVVGASLVCGLAFQDNIKSFLIYSKESCRTVLKEAVVLGRKQRDSIHTKAIHKWLDEDSKTPILVVDNYTDVLTSNRAAKTEFVIDSNNKQEILDLLHSSQFADVSDGKCRLNETDWWFHKDTIMMINSQFDVYQFYAQTPQIFPSKKAPTIDQPLIYKSKLMTDLIERTDLYANSPSHVLIIGESGTGKEMIAKRIHQKSQFAEGRFVAINCAAMPSELFEGELFGYVEGAFTGSKRGGKHGLLYEAENGVLFLDEVGELTLPQQAKLLRVIQEKTYRPIGSHKEFKVNLKVIAATNRPLATQVKQGLFRDDLYYRLNVLSINVPSLKERREDIENITQNKLTALNFGSLGDDVIQRLTQQLTPVFKAYDWPGNIRELENIVERLLVYCSAFQDVSSKRISQLLTDLAPELFETKAVEQTGAIAKNEQELLNQAMTKFNGNKELVAQYLGISQTTLWRRLKRNNNNNQEGKHHA
ncbi:sigma 54-interacting transcriptional regulator [Aliiglaciecola sp. 3_MG-2023]|uniref:sigma 54-interacting transcriptional regulator n=1 Tax=Aliiglaciecola sp. 3_MG-2023 TaxID=3062644 RepID=UPI0026E28DB4|nr:sigma 54-interacting transcriptional regulator [Aliiglaciecola sp. 3_MG-2023]MDO6692000.1 sigma 54-interacting transcriptional regulator [Aliiglaciecola sp. 3_MG-2023]